MPSVTIAFTATERLISGISSGTPYQIEVDLTQFDRNIDRRANRLTTLSGVSQTSKLYVVDEYSVQSSVIEDTIQKPDFLAEFEMFIYSTMGGESYQITNIDDGGVLQVINIGTPSRQRLSSKLQQFFYNWTIRTV